MKIILISIALVWLTTTAWTHAAGTESPDGQFLIRAGDSLVVQNAAGEPVLVLTKMGGAKQVQVAWSPDSQRVVVITNFGEGSAVFGAWREGNTWHKTLELDSDLSPVTKAIQSNGGRVVSESRSLGQWIARDAVTVRGEMISRGNKSWLYTYTLHFASGGSQSYTLDRGGYEEGALVGKDFQML
jgi:hypothetical protein